MIACIAGAVVGLTIFPLLAWLGWLVPVGLMHPEEFRIVDWIIAAVALTFWGGFLVGTIGYVTRERERWVQFCAGFAVESVAFAGAVLFSLMGAGIFQALVVEGVIAAHVLLALSLQGSTIFDRRGVR